ncbi:MAG: T9SS type A sorting domain-containing protein [Cytophagaceae bacterium]
MFSNFYRTVGVLIVFLSFHLGVSAQCTLNAGADLNECYPGGLPSPQALHAQSTGFTTFQWTSSGTGTFSRTDTTSVTYLPTMADATAGSVTLTLTASGGSCTSITDQLTVTFNVKPTVNVADKGITVCTGSKTLSSTVNGATTPTYLWNTSGLGNFSNTGGLTPSYTPTANELTNKQTVYFGLLVTSSNGCTAYDSTFIKFANQASIDVTSPMSNGVPCNLPNQQIFVNGSVAGDNPIFNWASNGTGTFLNPSSAAPIYQFTAADRATGFVKISGTISTTSCGNATDTIVINFSQQPITSRRDTTTCTNSVLTIKSFSVIGASKITWIKHVGNGTLDTTGNFPIYYPSASDVSLPYVRITFLASENGCNRTDTVKIQVLSAATVVAGINQTVCGITPILLNGQASNTTGVNWGTTGTGFFNNGNTLAARYTPSAADVDNGFVVLGLSATSTSCGASYDSLMVYFGTNPLVNAGADVSVCGDSVLLIGSVEYGSGASWSTSGTGSFYPSNGHLVSSYRFSVADKTAGSVTFTLTSASQSGCTSASDTKTVTIGGGSTVAVNAGPDKLSAGNAVNIIATSTGATTYSWSTFGTGTFSTTSALTTVYTPSLNDVASGSVDLYITASSGVCGEKSDVVRILFNNTYSISGKVTANGSALLNGFVALFRINPTTQVVEVERYDSLLTNENGNYMFGMLPAGSYYVLAVPTSFGNYFPTYNGNVASWSESSALVISNSALSNVNISLLPLASALPNWNTGTDTLSGVLVSTTNTSGARLIGANDLPLSNTVVYLTTADGDVITYTSTDKNGRFMFPNLISGNYIVLPEVAGAELLNENPSISVDGNPATIEGSSLVVSFPSLTTGVLSSTTTKAFQVYPNPTQEQVQFVSVWNGTTQITILNEMGMEMRVEQVYLSQGTTHEISLNGLSKGLYLIQCSNGAVIYQTKVVKQ